VHGGAVPPPVEEPIAPPIYQTATFAFDDAEAYASALRHPDAGFAYTRYHNPTTAALEAAVADLEGGAVGLAFASGMAAISTVVLSLAAGGRVVAQPTLYGGTYALFHKVLPDLGLTVDLVDPEDGPGLRAALDGGAAVLYAETIANPTMAVADLPALAAAARTAGATLVVDNTVASPALCRPLTFGAGVVVHSATKYLAGHNDVLAGVAVFAEAGMRDRVWERHIDLGAAADPFAAWLVLRGLRTLPLRMERHCENARALAGMLQAHAGVERVYWPGRDEHATAARARAVLDGPGGFLACDLAGGRAAGRRFVEALQVGRQAPSLGGPQTLASHPASTTHRQLDDAALAAAGIGQGLVRISAGLEDADDLVEDCEQALAAART
jgi:cystathionine beta-lyase/cystathionine gamma-synthase